MEKVIKIGTTGEMFIESPSLGLAAKVERACRVTRQAENNSSFGSHGGKDFARIVGQLATSAAVQLNLTKSQVWSMISIAPLSFSPSLSL